MKCPKCQHENTDDASLCVECGHNFPPSANLSVEAKREKLQQYFPKGLTEKILAQKDKIEGERKQVTVMFCDMAGYTAMVERVGAEAAYFLMDKVYEILIHEVQGYEGTVNELTGDGIMALFGAPIALEDGPQRALRSALAIQRQMSRFNEQNQAKEPVQMRIGIHTGPVVVGTLGNDLRVEFKAVGDTVNLASRMEGMAEPGSTYVTRDTFKLTKELFDFESLGKREVKGKKNAVDVYKVLSAKKDVYRHRLGAERMIYSRMVGRDKELDKLELQVMKAVNGEGSIVNITGEAGIGKSRLVAELKNLSAMRKVTLLEGRAVSMGRNLSFHPIIDVVNHWAQIREGDSQAVAFTKLENSVRRVYPEQIHEILPFLAILIGMKLSGRYAERVKGIEGEALEKLILKNVREFLVKSTEIRPLVIVTEDLHWADASSIDLIESLFSLVETQRILFINVFRPGHKETGDRIAETIRERFPDYYVEIMLQPLDKRMSETLINNMLKIKGFHHDFIDQIVERSGGNPFFIEEVIRSFIDEGAVVAKEGVFEVTAKVNNMVVPLTINDVLMARIDRLEETTRNLVKVASVIGRNFYYRILSEVADFVDNLDERLSHLKEVQILRERQRKGELEYLFKHTLAQEAAYDSLLPRKREELHLKVADSIEKVFRERLHEFYGMLAFHYSKAESLKKAEYYLLKAGEEALKSSASSEALHYYQEALNLYLKEHEASVDPEKVAMIEKNIALALSNRGRYEEALEYFDRALNYYWGELPRTRISSAYRFLLGFLHFLVSLYLPFLKFRKVPSLNDNQSIDFFFKKLKFLAILNPKQFFIQSFYFYRRVTDFDLTKIESGPGIFVGASSLFSLVGISFGLSKKVLDFAKDKVVKDDIKSFTIYDVSETLHNYLEGNWEAIKDYDEYLIERNLDIGEIYFAAQHLYWHGCPKLHQGHTHAAELIVNKLRDLYEVYENDFPMLLKYLLNTSLLMECRKLDDALIEIEQGIGFGQRISQGSLLIEMYARKAHICALLEDIEGAERSLNFADKVRSEIETVPWQLNDFFRSKFEIDLYHLREALLKGVRKESNKYKRKARKSAGKLLKVAKKVALIRTESYRLMGVYCWLVENQQEALKWWRKSIDEGERLRAKHELSRTYLEVGKHLLEARSKYKKLNEISADEYLEKARLLFEEMDLQWDLDKLHQLARADAATIAAPI